MTTLTTTGTAPLLSVRGLQVDYSRGTTGPAVDGVDLDVRPGSMTAVVGESGSGKSTTANAVIGLLPESARITAGSIHLGEESLTDLSASAWRGIRGSRIGYVPQDPGNSLNPLRTIGKSVAEALRIHRRADAKSARAQVIELLEKVGIDRPELRVDQYPHELSGGMRQRVLIASAIALRPSLLIADEPTSALDVTVQKQVLDLLDELRAETGMGILFITHDLAVAGERADEVVVMQSGRVVEAGPAGRVFSAPATEYASRLLADAPALMTKTRRPAPTAADAGAERPFVSVEGLTQVYARSQGQVIGVEDVSFTVERGTTLGIVGESGSGKTTTGKAIAGFLSPQSGRLRVGDFDAADLGRGWAGRRRRLDFRRTVQLVHQNPYSALDPTFSIRQTLLEPLRNFRIGTRASRQETIETILDRVALPASFLDRRPRELSGGQLQRVAIARALIAGPELVVFDEAVSALDVTVQAQILALLDELQAEFGLTYVFISHDLAVVRQIADTVAVMSHGRLVETGPTEDLFARPRTEYTRTLLDAIPRPVSLGPAEGRDPAGLGNPAGVGTAAEHPGSGRPTGEARPLLAANG
ncbi:peptide/nickel transport system ATP-binding protein [Brevibacterium sanguinis]|uniref:Peptide/nickel transport system ATP-binding protein n=2 Tax=Brevibacterium TaxID=1696 RepID=A0A366IEV8_9MICO|nr:MULTISPECIES: ABC transporter ATP-binding protein [Brevibacterium]RBP63456.1 peptide/nickel transport system ATP-binding protein [Brevibacterium sanguinis]RBP69923.1 peptide/nickel transport system ATP-binding protein [Brevibacterium celere]